MDIKVFKPSSYLIKGNLILLVFDKECIFIEGNNGFYFSNSEILEVHFDLNSKISLNACSKFVFSSVFSSKEKIEVTFAIDELEAVSNLKEKIIEFVSKEEASQIIEKLEKMNIENAINLSLDMKDKDMFLNLVNGVY